LVHTIPGVAAEHGIDHLPVLAAVGLDGSDPAWSGQVVARARIAALLMLMARETGDETLGLDLASAADPAALGPAGLAPGIGRTLGEGIASHIRHMPSLQGGLDYRLLREGDRVRLLHRFHGGTVEEARVLSEGVAAFMLKAVRGMAGDATLPVHIEFPHRPRVPVVRYEDKLQAAVTFRPGDAIRLSFDSRYVTLVNRANRDTGSVESRSLTAADSVLDDGALVAAIAKTFAPAALAGRLSLSHVAAMLALAGAPITGTQPIDGMDVWQAVAAGQPSPREDMVYNVEPGQGAIRVGDWKLHWIPTLPPLVELFDLGADPGETTNLADAHPEIVADLQARVVELARTMAPPLLFASAIGATYSAPLSTPVDP
jgi:hypothetical protein